MYVDQDTTRAIVTMIAITVMTTVMIVRAAIRCFSGQISEMKTVVSSVRQMPETGSRFMVQMSIQAVYGFMITQSAFMAVYLQIASMAHISGTDQATMAITTVIREIISVIQAVTIMIIAIPAVTMAAMTTRIQDADMGHTVTPITQMYVKQSYRDVRHITQLAVAMVGGVGKGDKGWRHFSPVQQSGVSFYSRKTCERRIRSQHLV